MQANGRFGYERPFTRRRRNDLDLVATFQKTPAPARNFALIVDVPWLKSAT